MSPKLIYKSNSLIALMIETLIECIHFPNDMRNRKGIGLKFLEADFLNFQSNFKQLILTINIISFIHKNKIF
jgi:hypothetical protein